MADIYDSARKNDLAFIEARVWLMRRFPAREAARAARRRASPVAGREWETYGTDQPVSEPWLPPAVSRRWRGPSPHWCGHDPALRMMLQEFHKNGGDINARDECATPLTDLSHFSSD
jgi:hypothetical protein